MQKSQLDHLILQGQHPNYFDRVQGVLSRYPSRLRHSASQFLRAPHRVVRPTSVDQRGNINFFLSPFIHPLQISKVGVLPQKKHRARDRIEPEKFYSCLCHCPITLQETYL
uniref:Uncharacterized protein n=1 Tax=Photinus pyralis TaxID=7054 RepID=A0A1Y1LCK1_PHOPY